MPRCPPRWAGNRRPTFAEGADEQARTGAGSEPRAAATILTDTSMWSP